MGYNYLYTLYSIFFIGYIFSCRVVTSVTTVLQLRKNVVQLRLLPLGAFDVINMLNTNYGIKIIYSLVVRLVSFYYAD